MKNTPIVLLLILIFELPKITKTWSHDYVPLAKSTWPQIRANPLNTGLAQVNVTERSLCKYSYYWEFSTGKGIWTTPSIGPKGEIIVGSADKYLYCLSENGQLMWTYETDEIIDTAVAITEDSSVILAAADGFLYSIELGMGQMKWKFAAHHSEKNDDHKKGSTCPDWSMFFGLFGPEGGPSNWFEGHVTLAPKGRILVGNDNYRLYSISPNGTEEWVFFPGPIPFGTIWSAPFVREDGSVVFSSMDCAVYSVTHDGKCQWKTYLLGPSSSTPALDPNRGILYIGSWDNRLYAIKEKTGEILWSFSTKEHVYGSAAIGLDGTVYFGSTDGNLYALSPTGRLLWTYGLFDPIRSNPAISTDGIIFFGAGDGKLYALNNDGTLKWSFDTSISAKNALNGAPALGRTSVVIGSQDGRIINIPYGYCEQHPEDKRCLLGVSKINTDLPYHGSFIYYVHPAGMRVDDDHIRDPIHRSTVLTFLLLVRKKGVTLKTKISATTLIFQPPVQSFTTCVNSKWINIIPDHMLLSDSDYFLDVQIQYDTMNSTEEVTRRFRFHTVSEPKEENPQTAKIFAPTHDQVMAFRLSGMAPYQLPVIMSLNQIGFESLDLLCSVIHVGNVDQNRFFVWLLGGHLGHGGIKVDPHTYTRSLFVGQKAPDGQSVLLTTHLMRLITGGPLIPIDKFRIASQLLENKFWFNSTASVFSSSSCFNSRELLLMWFYGGYCNSENDFVSVGSIESQPLPSGDGLVKRPVGVECEGIISRLSEKYWQLQLIAILPYNPAEFHPEDHILTLILFDDETDTAVLYDHHHDIHIENGTSRGDGGVTHSSEVLWVVLSVPHAVKYLPKRTRVVVLVDLFPVFSEVLDPEKIHMTHHFWYHLFGNEMTVLLSSTIILLLYDQTLRHLPPKPSDRAWLLTLASALVTSLSGCYITYNLMTRPQDMNFHDFVWNDHILSRATLYYFLAYLFLDLFIGSYQYSFQITVMTGYIHHLVYTGFSLYLLVNQFSNVLVFFFVLEIPTVIMAVGRLRKKWRWDMGFGVSFFVTRILYHVWLMYVLWPSIVESGKFGVFVLGIFLWLLHWYWFLSWLRGEIRRRKKKKMD